MTTENTENTCEVPLETLEVYYLDDILSLFPGEFEDDFNENWLTSGDISFGDATYTLVAGHRIDRLLHDCWDDGDYATDAMKEDIWSRLPVLFNGGTLVAIRG